MSECNECGRRFEAARSSKKYCSTACKQSAYLRRAKNDGNDRAVNDDKATVTELADPIFRGDFYGKIGRRDETEVYGQNPLSVSDDNSDANDDKPVTVNDDKIMTIKDAKSNLPTTNSHRQTSSPSSHNDARYTKHGYDASRSLSARKQRFLMKAGEKAARKNLHGNTTHKTGSGKDEEPLEVRQKHNPLVPVVVEKPHENQITRIMQPEDDAEPYQWIIPDFFNRLNDETDKREYYTDWFANQPASYYIDEVNRQWMAIVCQVISLSWHDEDMLVAHKPIYQALEKLVTCYSFQELRYCYPYAEKIKRTHQYLQDLFNEGYEEIQLITIGENVALEYHCILHELSAAMSTNPG